LPARLLPAKARKRIIVHALCFARNNLAGKSAEHRFLHSERRLHFCMWNRPGLEKLRSTHGSSSLGAFFRLSSRTHLRFLNIQLWILIELQCGFCRVTSGFKTSIWINYTTMLNVSFGGVLNVDLWGCFQSTHSNQSTSYWQLVVSFLLIYACNLSAFHQVLRRRI
jgi:hypothetical protein